MTVRSSHQASHDDVEQTETASILNAVRLQRTLKEGEDFSSGLLLCAVHEVALVTVSNSSILLQVSLMTVSNPSILH